MFTTIGRLLRRVKKQSLLVNDFVLPSPPAIWVAGKTGGLAEAKLIPLSHAEKLLGVCWTDNIHAHHFNPVVFNSIQYDDLNISLNELSARQQDLYGSCIIRWIDENIGWVVTLKPGKMLKKGFLCCYTGVLTEFDLQQISSYSEREYFFSLLKTEKTNWGVDAKTQGNISRFLPFLLAREYLENFSIDSTSVNQIAVANLQFRIMAYDGFPIPYVYAPQDIIAPPDQELLLGVHYSLPYLYKMCQSNSFRFLNKTTFSQIDPLFYSPKLVRVNLLGLSYSFQIPRLRIMIAKQLPNLQHRSVGFDETTKVYYEIIVSDSEIYQELMKCPGAESVMVKPVIKMRLADE